MPQTTGCGKSLATELGQVAPGGDAELGRERLDQHRHQVAGDDDPEQQVAELRAALDVGGEVAGVHVGDAGDERRAEERKQPGKAAFLALPAQDLRCRLHGRVIVASGAVGCMRSSRAHHMLPFTRIICLHCNTMRKHHGASARSMSIAASVVHNSARTDPRVAWAEGQAKGARSHSRVHQRQEVDRKEGAP